MYNYLHVCNNHFKFYLIHFSQRKFYKLFFNYALQLQFRTTLTKMRDLADLKHACYPTWTVHEVRDLDSENVFWNAHPVHSYAHGMCIVFV